jgi:hypothetical protein
LAAIKIIKLEPGENLDEVLNEVNFLRDCSHRNIVSYMGCYLKQGPVKGQRNIWVLSTSLAEVFNQTNHADGVLYSSRLLWSTVVVAQSKVLTKVRLECDNFNRDCSNLHSRSFTRTFDRK